MKRTEKIEVRVSLEEKQTLTNLARQDGESVSGLIRGLVEKYIALNSASTIRRLPTWKIAAGLIIAALIGHGLTLLPMHLHERGHKAVEAPAPVYMVHGAIGNAAFGVTMHVDDRSKDFVINSGTDMPVRVKLAFAPNTNYDGGGSIKIQICETETEDLCNEEFETKMDIDRVVPSILGNSLTSGKPVHIFVQEMA